MPAEPVLARRFMVFYIAAMFVYHLTFDLNYFGVVSFDFNNDLRGNGDPANHYHRWL